MSDISWDTRTDISPDSWMKCLLDEKYTHVLLHNVDDVFRQEYGELFNKEPQNEELYRVTEQGLVYVK